MRDQRYRGGGALEMWVHTLHCLVQLSSTDNNRSTKRPPRVEEGTITSMTEQRQMIPLPVWFRSLLNQYNLR